MWSTASDVAKGSRRERAHRPVGQAQLLRAQLRRERQVHRRDHDLGGRRRDGDRPALEVAGDEQRRAQPGDDGDAPEGRRPDTGLSRSFRGAAQTIRPPENIVRRHLLPPLVLCYCQRITAEPLMNFGVTTEE
jgi:hypothetical protein